ncbi:1,2-phenylacetyl-CoA epoxidase subunit PaaC [Spirillospora sp. NBC_01491]|uniref:1,2-phenylacetyl-CoA epoxidase subunit PaaC n=1 Tax=Spirillospora sp. NBC_01491 TaxID=2976007 RepID=UPI002E2EEC07|nr:1,2-phenylacetyl-CoA epoxidase subunit PaaC [Spirillospora sp. NBC_01491]
MGPDDDTLAADGHWAFGTGFSDPLSGLPMPPAGADLAALCLALGDDALVMSHRLQEWCTRAPELEDEVALANIALDLLGQARLLLARTGRDEDELAFRRGAGEFRNVRLAEVPNGDFAHLVVRLLVFSTWRLGLLTRLRDSDDEALAAIAAKGVKEVAYHRGYAARWTIRLGDGTAHSHERTRQALAAVWPLVDQLFAADGNPRSPDPADLREEFDAVVGHVLAEATLTIPETAAERASRDEHTGALAVLLEEMQSVARALPGATW